MGVQQLRQDVITALREAQDIADRAERGSAEHQRALDAVDQLRRLLADMESAMRLGVRDRGHFAALFEELRPRPTSGA
jgi:hypothetical protein